MVADYDDRLPDELLTSILDYASLLEISYASAVSRRWRAVALDHPTYWQSICIDSLSPRASAFFNTRLERARSRPIEVFVRFMATYFEDKNHELPDSLFQGIRRHIFHMKSLHLRMAFKYAEKMVEALSQPAPILESLGIDFYQPVGPSPFLRHEHVVLPAGLFANHAPKLTSLELRNAITSSQASSCFARVDYLALSFRFDPSDSEDSVPPDFAHFPSLKRLALAGHIPLAYLEKAPWRSLDQLIIERFAAYSPHWTLWRTWPLVDISYIGTDFVNDEVITILGQHLQGRLDLHLGVQPGVCFFARFRSRLDGRRRMVREFTRTAVAARDSYKGWDGKKPPPHDLFSRPLIVDRIVHLTMPATLWIRLTGYFAVLPALEELVIPLHNAGELSSLGDKRLVCPTLSSVTFLGIPSGAGVIRIQLADVSRFVETFIECDILFNQRFENVDVVGSLTR
ncbi:hypothetical protein EXIGLDRAFT_736616 [Exidia glandulosa HHB12029]|uniref:F-box domain-containing protein n=1 Tax=Exidia glandulosa HHB12029 TaxID=1314781 RepID=A0A165JB12_EXIGL|nr:hypothetical protein EXIGLDRAFT_736616 [Exidia glandulosa HHB12029]